MGSKPPQPGDLEKEGERLIAHLEDAFRSASRSGGVSWSEAGVMDSYGTEEEQAEARASDTDRRWMELVDDPEWNPEEGWGDACFYFLDAIGFRYYLAAWMMRILRGQHDGWGLRPHLTLAAHDDHRRQDKLDQWSALDRKQKLFIARFVNFMVAAAEAADDADGAVAWRKVKESYWGDIE